MYFSIYTESSPEAFSDSDFALRNDGHFMMVTYQPHSLSSPAGRCFDHQGESYLSRNFQCHLFISDLFCRTQRLTAASLDRCSTLGRGFHAGQNPW